VRIAEARPSFC